MSDHDYDIIERIDALSVSELKAKLKEHGMSAHGLKSELVTKLALRYLKAEELAAGHLDLALLTVPELRELKMSLGVKGTASTKASMVQLIRDCIS